MIGTLPNTALGLLLELLTLQRPRAAAAGALVFDRGPRGAARAFRRVGVEAVTLGLVIVSARPLAGAALAHELHHVRQYRRWGPAFVPVYLLFALLYGRRTHPFEVAARRAALGRRFQEAGERQP